MVYLSAVYDVYNMHIHDILAFTPEPVRTLTFELVRSSVFRQTRDTSVTVPLQQRLLTSCILHLLT